VASSSLALNAVGLSEEICHWRKVGYERTWSFGQNNACLNHKIIEMGFVPDTEVNMKGDLEPHSALREEVSSRILRDLEVGRLRLEDRKRSRMLEH
jgi:Fe2+ transport system protein FeoA